MQAKLAVGQVNDPLEHEADRVADQVTRAPAPGLPVTRVPPRISRKCAACEEDARLLQPKMRDTSAAPARGAPGLVQDVLRTPGQPLDPASRAFFEPRFGNDFSQVRIHADTHAAASARSVDARAYTVGQHVVFGHGRYAPHTADGRHLLAHELTHTLQQRGGATGVQRSPDPPPSPPPVRPDLDVRLKVIEETAPAMGARLDQIIRTGGPTPTTTKVIGAAIIDVEGYTGPREMRAISGADSDALGAGAAVYHASSPNPRTLSATRSIAGSGPRRDFPFAHINDAEMKLFEDIIARLPPGAKGTIYFTTMRVRVVNGQALPPEPYQACSGCIRASFEASGSFPTVDLVSHAPVHPTGTANIANPPAPHGEHDEPIANPQGQKPGSVHMSPHDADVDPATGRVVAGPNTDAAVAGRAQRLSSKPPAAPEAEGPVAAPPGRYAGPGIAIGTTIATLGLGWLAAKLKARVDRKNFQQQYDAFLEVARKKINANPDAALKRMMSNPEGTVYAWVHLDSAVITTIGLDPHPQSLEFTLNDSSPVLDLGPIEFQTAPVDQALAATFPQIIPGAHHATTVYTIVIDIPLVTPPLEDLIGYAKSRNLPLDDLQDYATSRLQGAMSSSQSALEARQSILNAHQTTQEAFESLQAAFKLAQKRKDVELQKQIAEKLLSVSQSSARITGQLAPIGEHVQKADAKVRYWHHILDLIKPAGSRP